MKNGIKVHQIPYKGTKNYIKILLENLLWCWHGLILLLVGLCVVAGVELVGENISWTEIYLR